MVKRNVQIPLGKEFSKMPDNFRHAAHLYFYKILPVLSTEYNAITQLGPETNLEAFEELIEEGGVKLIPYSDYEGIGGFQVWLFNLVTRQYEDITFLKEEIEEIGNEDS